MSTKKSSINRDTLIAGSGVVIGIGSLGYAYREIARVQAEIDGIKNRLAKSLRLLERHLQTTSPFRKETQRQMVDLSETLDQLWKRDQRRTETMKSLVDAVVEIQDILEDNGNEIKKEVYYNEKPRSDKHRKRNAIKHSRKSKKSSRKRIVSDSESDSESSSNESDTDFMNIMAQARARRSR